MDGPHKSLKTVEIGLPPETFVVRGLAIPRAPLPPGPVTVHIAAGPPSPHAYDMDVFAAASGGPHRPLGRNAQSRMMCLYIAALRDVYKVTRKETAARVGLSERKVQDYHHRGAEIWRQYGAWPWALESDGTARFTARLLDIG